MEGLHPTLFVKKPLLKPLMQIWKTQVFKDYEVTFTVQDDVKNVRAKLNKGINKETLNALKTTCRQVSLKLWQSMPTHYSSETLEAFESTANMVNLLSPKKPKPQSHVSDAFAAFHGAIEEVERTPSGTSLGLPVNRPASAPMKGTVDRQFSVPSSMATVSEAEGWEPRKPTAGAVDTSQRRNSDPSGQTKPQVCGLKELKRGSAMLKYGRRGSPHFRRFQLTQNNKKIRWFSRKKTIKDTTIPISSIRQVVQGQKTAVFKKCSQPALARASFSLIYRKDGMTLDLVAKSREEAELWITAIRQLMDLTRNGINLSSLTSLPLPIKYTDITKPGLKRKRPRNTRPHNLQLKGQIQLELDSTRKLYRDIIQATKAKQFKSHPESTQVCKILREIDTRMDEADTMIKGGQYELQSIKRDVWILKVDVAALDEKVVVLTQTPKSMYHDI